MDLDTLIAALQALRTAHGNLPVVINTNVSYMRVKDVIASSRCGTHESWWDVRDLDEDALDPHMGFSKPGERYVSIVGG